LTCSSQKSLVRTELRKEWFERLLQLTLVATITDSYRPFDKLAKAALRVTATALGMELSAWRANPPSWRA
jgi:hypothetical protein